MVDVGQFLIDSTEVTNAQYQLFLDADIPQEWMDFLEPTVCSWKTDFIPDNWPAANPDRPVAGVDWCDAMVYCYWAGRHLCGRIGGGEANVNLATDANENEWYYVCSDDGTNTYPYGGPYDPMACNTVDYAAGLPLDVGSIPTCEGGFPGVFDMSGNVWEWSNSCEHDPNVADNEQRCTRRGGSYFNVDSDTRCGVDSRRARDFRNVSHGFRCCGYP
jgi:formylglycine-generating enzyme required for sulfatase activity